ncbi:MAG: M24 family metallopeptidase [Terriglobia bacterium]
MFGGREKTLDSFPRAMLTTPIPYPFRARQRALRELLEAQRIPVLVVTKPVNIYYLTGFRGSAGAAVLGRDHNLLLVDPRYTLQAQNQARGVEVAETKDSMLKAVAKRASGDRLRRAGFEDTHLTFSDFEFLRHEARDGLRWVPAGGLVENLRAVKDEAEIEQIRQSCRLTSEVFEAILKLVKPGVRESDLAAEIEHRMKKQGAEGSAFETIVASGPRAALPHGRASEKRLQSGELVIFDLGAILGGYASDMTRTVYLGTPPRRVKALYRAVLQSQQQAAAVVGDGISARAVDAKARQVLQPYGLAKHFTHSTGHGVGLEIHEQPRIARTEKSRLRRSQVVTVEPGIYLEGFGGIRIEDTIAIGNDGPEALTVASKDNWILD